MAYGGMKGERKRPPVRRRERRRSRENAPDSKSQEQYKKNLEIICKMLEYPGDVKRDYGDSGKEMIEKGFKLLKTQMDAVMFEGKLFPVHPDQEALIFKLVDTLIHAVLYKAINPMIRDMSLQMTKLIFNWNAQLLKKQSMTEKTQILERLVSGHLALVDMVKVSKRVLGRLDSTFNRRPPAFEYSRHLKEALEKELDERDADNPDT